LKYAVFYHQPVTAPVIAVCAGRKKMQDVQMVMPVQLMLLLMLLPGLVLIGIDYLLYHSIDKRIMLLAMVLALMLFFCTLIKPLFVL
jgi:hypothetical protein